MRVRRDPSPNSAINTAFFCPITTTAHSKLTVQHVYVSDITPSSFPITTPPETVFVSKHSLFVSSIKQPSLSWLVLNSNKYSSLCPLEGKL